MSDTPRMKAAQRIESECKVKEIWRVGCQLERELNAANQRIKWLEEAGDYIVEENDIHIGKEVWRKAKEAKP